MIGIIAGELIGSPYNKENIKGHNKQSWYSESIEKIAKSTAREQFQKEHPQSVKNKSKEEYHRSRSNMSINLRSSG